MNRFIVIFNIKFWLNIKIDIEKKYPQSVKIKNYIAKIEERKKINVYLNRYKKFWMNYFNWI